MLRSIALLLSALAAALLLEGGVMARQAGAEPAIVLADGRAGCC
jgi:hypothetical protein